MGLLKRRLPALLTVALLFVTACSLLGGGDNPALGSETVLAGDASLVCSQECADYGQCGSSAERGTVVLLSTVGPVTRNHDMAIPENTVVAIAQTRPETLVRLNVTEQFQVNYYQVNVPERGPGWVAGWCVGQ